MDRKRFLELLEKYLQGRTTPREEAMIDAWYERMGRSSDDGMEGENEYMLEKRYLSNLDHRMKNRAGEYRMVSWRSLRVAATIIFAVAASFSIWSGSEKAFFPDASPSADLTTPLWKMINNPSGNSLRALLPDGSLVILEPRSEVRFLSEFNNNERSVWLEGAAFFDVCRDEKKPFMVHARELTTKVLGTSFSVRAFKHDKKVAVAVRTGKVSVVTSHRDEGDSDKHEVILTPNQKIIYDKAQNKLARTIVEKPEIILPDEEVLKMRFEAAPVAEIFGAIEKVYGVDLVFDSTTFQSCTLTSVISDGELFNRLDIICKAIGARYALEENQIMIEGSGCTTK